MGLFGLFESKKSATSTSNTTSNVTDARSVTDASGGGIVGTGNSVAITDGGAFGVVSDAIDGVGQMGALQLATAVDLARINAGAGAHAIDSAIAAQSSASGFASDIATRAMDLARSGTAQAFASSGDALGLTRETLGESMRLVGQAYATAADTTSGNRTLIMAGLAAVAMVGLALAWRR